MSNWEEGKSIVCRRGFTGVLGKEICLLRFYNHEDWNIFRILSVRKKADVD